MRALAVLLTVLLAGVVTAQEPAPAWQPEQREVRIPMRDGESLAADVYLPTEPGRYPAVLIQTPYNKRGIGSPMAGRGRKEGLFDRAHYAYIVVDWRGFFGSRDAKTAGRPDRGLDGYDCVEWVAAQPWCNGKVGTWGPSALGRVQFDTAMAQPPHLVCAVPVSAPLGQLESHYFVGGVLLEAHLRDLDRLGFGAGAGVRAARGKRLFWQLAERRTYRPERVAVPMLLVAGWWDHFPDEVLQTYTDLRARSAESVRAHHRLLMGPWDHMSIGQARQGEWSFPAAAPEYERAVRAFLDHWLRGETPEGWTDEPPVRTWRIHEDGWTGAAAWPGVEARTVAWHLRADGTLAPEAGDGSFRRFTIDPDDLPPTLGGANLPPMRHGPWDQAPLCARPDVLVWDSPPIAEPLRIAGAARLTVACEADGPAFDLAARWCIVGEDGRAMLLNDSIARAATRPGGATHRATVTVALPAIAATVPAGQRLRLILAGGNQPRFERNPDCRAKTVVTVFAAGSRLEIPVAGR